MLIKIPFALLYLVLVCIILTGFSNAKDHYTDSLLTILGNLPDDTAKIDILNHCAKELSAKNPDSALTLAEQAMELSGKLNEEYGRAKALNVIGIIYFYKAAYEKSLDIHQQSLEIRKKINDVGGIAASFNCMGEVYRVQGIFDKAIENYLLSLKYAEDIGDTLGIAATLGNIGIIYYRQENYDKAIEYFTESYEKNSLAGNRYGIASSLNNIGAIYRRKNDYEHALEFYLKSLKIKEELGNKVAIAMTLNNIGEIHQLRKNYSESHNYYMKALRMREQINDKNGIAMSYLNLGSLGLAQQNYELSVAWYNRALSVARQIGEKDMIKEIYAGLSLVYEKKNDYKSAYEYFIKYSGIKDSILNDETSRQITEMQTKYESDKKGKEITILKKDKEIRNSEVRREKLMRNSFIGALVLALLLALLLYNRYLIKRRANIRLADQNEKIRMQKDLIEEQKQNITDSIEYACNIQKAMLPTHDEFTRLFPEAFILYRPRDIVSGDFYWVASPPSYPPVGGMAIFPFPTGKVGRGASPPPTGEAGRGASPPPTGEVGWGAVLIACCDCTGHGVPGAFMSMLCTALLNEAVNDKGLTKPNEIFEEVRKGIIGALKQRGQTGGSKDGMDATIIKIRQFVETHGRASLQIACANNPVYIVSKGSLTEIPPNRFPVGVHENEQKPFTCHEMEVIKGDMIYSITDGFEDQLGGEKGKKFKSAQLRELLVSIANKPVDEQKEILKKTFEEWKGSGEQTDDVTIIGIKV